ncbi:MAG TPA: M20/M25/M40 family metallo-hydrolase, partial [Pyrinomonadaceae bacterium]|nr:M20/M25/M40 family metallo-hydrolase [Pyrinomonadaceae bacterium]
TWVLVCALAFAPWLSSAQTGDVRPAGQQQPSTTIPPRAESPTPTPSPTPLPPAPTVDIRPYRDEAGRIIGAALSDDTAYRRLAYLSDRIGHRLSGSPQLEQAIRWALEEMRRDGLERVRAEKVMVPHWVRGEESVELLEPAARRLVMLGLGGSVATPPEGITAEAIVVRDFGELERLGERVRGKIVVYNVPFTNYRETVQYRSSGASRAARLGASAALIRSVGPTGRETPHTGSLRYDADQPKIPAAALTAEGAETLARMQARGERVRLRLKMEARFLPDAESANVVAEWRGRERPEEVVLVSGHFDSWDVGHGAHDDGGGCLAAWEVLRLLKQLKLRPRRTIRVVLFTNEENGLRGANAYRDAHRAELPNHVLAIESDSGIFRPTGFGLDEKVSAQTRSNIREIAKLLSTIGADRIDPTGGGADIGPIMREGVAGMGLNVGGNYFEFHHTPADTFDKIDPQDFALCVATMAVMAYVAADAPARVDK